MRRNGRGKRRRADNSGKTWGELKLRTAEEEAERNDLGPTLPLTEEELPERLER